MVGRLDPYVVLFLEPAVRREGVMAQAVAAPNRARDPNHKVEIEPSPRWVRVVFNGQTIADSKNAKLLRETGSRPVYYFPKEDVRMDLMEPTTQHTTCPYKGLASYWTLK